MDGKSFDWSTLLVTFYCGIISAKVLLENLYCRFFKKFGAEVLLGNLSLLLNLIMVNFPAEALVENIYCRSFSGELLLHKFYWRNLIAEGLLQKFYCTSFTGEIFTAELQLGCRTFHRTI